eukprot:gene3459-6094_t
MTLALTIDRTWPSTFGLSQLKLCPLLPLAETYYFYLLSISTAGLNAQALLTKGGGRSWVVAEVAKAAVATKGITDCTGGGGAPGSSGGAPGGGGGAPGSSGGAPGDPAFPVAAIKISTWEHALCDDVEYISLDPLWLMCDVMSCRRLAVVVVVVVADDAVVVVADVVDAIVVS